MVENVLLDDPERCRCLDYSTGKGLNIAGMRVEGLMPQVGPAHNPGHGIIVATISGQPNVGGIGIDLQDSAITNQNSATQSPDREPSKQ